MADDYVSITDSLLLVAVIVAWSYALNWLGYRVPVVQRIVYPKAIPAVSDGVPDADVLRRYLLTHEEPLSQLRLQGVRELDEVERAYIEGNGQISVVTANHASRGNQGSVSPDLA